MNASEVLVCVFFSDLTKGVENVGKISLRKHESLSLKY